VVPFRVEEPSSGESPVLVEAPHAGLYLDAEALAFTVAPARAIARDADLHVDELFSEVTREGATLIAANVSRYEVDLNRSETDFDRDAAEGGGNAAWPRGLFWRLTTDGEPVVAAPLPRAEVQRRLELIYRPYHRAVEALVQRKLQRFGVALIICAHSMPSTGRSRDGTSFVRRADVVPGTRGRTSASGAVIDLVDAEIRAQGWSVRHDDPYKGGYSTGHYGRPALGCHAVQIELARRLYMDEVRLRMDPQGARAVRQFSRSLVARLASAAPNHAAQRSG
jgi:N-formylglutamate amidohydrolase